MLNSILKSSIFVLVITCFAQATVFNVPDDADTIQDAVWLCYNSNSIDGDVIELTADTTYTGEGNYDIKLYGLKITVRSENPDDPQIVASTVIDCQGKGRAFTLKSNETSETVISGITIRNGDGGLLGGAFYFLNSSAVVTNCVIENNSATLGGAIAVSNNGSFPVIKNCQIVGNTAVVSGGAVYIIGGNTVIENCIISDNYARMGGAIYGHYPGNSVISQCTIVGNAAELDAGAIYAFNQSNMELYGSIIWGNTSQSQAQIQVPDMGQATTLKISYCDIQGLAANVAVEEPCIVEWGQGNIDADPMFTTSQVVAMFAAVEGANDITDFTLDEDSPCVDKSDPGYNAQDKKDVYGEQRLFGDAVDIGASEFVEDEVIEAKLKMWPKVIKCNTRQKYFYCMIKMKDHETDNIDLDRIMLQGELQDTLEPVSSKKHKRAKELVLKFKMDDIKALIGESGESKGKLTLTVSGFIMENGTEIPFEASGKLKIHHEKSKGHDKHDEDSKKGKGHHKHDEDSKGKKK